MPGRGNPETRKKRAHPVTFQDARRFSEQKGPLLAIGEFAGHLRRSPADNGFAAASRQRSSADFGITREGRKRPGRWLVGKVTANGTQNPRDLQYATSYSPIAYGANGPLEEAPKRPRPKAWQGGKVTRRLGFSNVSTNMADSYVNPCPCLRAWSRGRLARLLPCERKYFITLNLCHSTSPPGPWSSDGLAMLLLWQPWDYAKSPRSAGEFSRPGLSAGDAAYAWVAGARVFRSPQFRGCKPAGASEDSSPRPPGIVTQRCSLLEPCHQAGPRPRICPRRTDSKKRQKGSGVDS